MVMRKETTRRAKRMTERVKARRKKRLRAKVKVKAMSELSSAKINFCLIILKDELLVPKKRTLLKEQITK